MFTHPWLAASFLTATLIQGVLQGALIWALRHVLETLGDQGRHGTRVLLVNASIIMGIWLLRSFSAFAAETMSVHLSHRVEMTSMLEILRKLLRLSIRFFDRHSQSDVVMASYYDLKGIRAVTAEVARIVLYLSQLIGLGVAAWVMSPKLALIGFVVVPVGVLPVYWLGQAITRAARGERVAVATLHQSFYQLASGMRVIKVNRSEARVLARAQEIGLELHHFLVRQALHRGLARLLLEVVAGIGLILMLTLGGMDVARGTLSWQSLLGLLFAMMAVYGPVIGLIQLYGSVRSIIPNLDRIGAIHAEPAELRDRPGARPLVHAPAIIELRDLRFRHREQVTLDGISARFNRGERIGIVGPSGAGKSTLLSLMLRFYDPDGGGIFLDGVDLREVRQADWMDRVAIVLQEPVLFLDTVANNIRLGRPDATMERVAAAARAAGIEEEILAMEHGYDTLIGSGAEARGLSTGQRQRICIAAALLKDAPILFLDEATSSLDAVAERKVQAAIDRLMEGRTTFVVAHRFSTLRNVDRILVLERGCLVGLGTHEELLESCPTYVSLWQSQELADSPRYGAPLVTVEESSEA